MVPVHIVQFSLAILALLLAFASAETKTREVNPPFCRTVDSKGKGTGQTLTQSEDDFNSFVLRGDAKAAVSVIFFNNTDNGYINKDNFESSVYVVEARLKNGSSSTTNYQVIKDTLCEIKEAKDWERLTGATYYGPGPSKENGGTGKKGGGDGKKGGGDGKKGGGDGKKGGGDGKKGGENDS